jgi:glycosyltransferase involved in cell wall biosynthesis
MNKPDTLVILSPGFPENEADSTCIAAQQVFVKNLKQNYPDLDIIVLAFEYPFKKSVYQWNGITVIASGGKNRGNFFRLFNWARIRIKLRQLNRQHRIIGVLSFWLGDCALIGSRFAKRNNLKHYCWILGQDAKARNKYFKRVRPQADSLIALSDFIAAEFERNYCITPAHTVPPGVDPSMFGKPALVRDIDILAAGSLIKLKQYHILVNMVSTLSKMYPRINVIVCGNGPELDSLNKMIRSLGLESNVKLFGEVPHSSVLKMMARARIFIHPSAYEGFGMVCLEALYAGARVVSFVKPMQVQIPNWHFAGSEDDMLAIVRNLLEETEPEHISVSPYLVKDSNAAIMKLFGYKEDAIS